MKDSLNVTTRARLCVRKSTPFLKGSGDLRLQLCVLVAVFSLLALPGLVLAQTATTGSVVGSVVDQSGAVVLGAEVELLDTTTNQSLKQATNDSGQYLFPSVTPGTYKITVTKQGFRQAVISAFKVDVAKSYAVNFQLEVGELSQTMDVSATAAVELETTSATVGNVLPGSVMPLFPALTRQANELLTLQPLAEPGGAVAGARSDQSTFSLDGIDVTNQSIGGLGTYTQLPIDAIEEFRVSVANPNAVFGRGAGGQVSVISRHGSSDFHGAAYWYHQNDALNAATWTNKRTLGQNVTDPVQRHKLQEPELKDNRFGFRVGGPILPWKDKLSFFLNYEGRRFPRISEVLRIVPSDSLRQGILRFRDASGNIRSYNLGSANLCGPTGNQPCDPRGLGLSPTIAALFSKMPGGNDPSSGDGLNTVGFRGTVGNSINNNFYNARVDYNISSKWRLDAAFRYFGQLQQGSNQVSIVGGNVQSVERFPLRQNYFTAGLSGQITDRLTGEFRFGWVRVRDASDRFRPNQSAAFLALPGTQSGLSQGQTHIALDLGGLGGANNLLSEPVDVDTQVARKQGNDNRNFQWNADLSWVKGTHTLQFGGHVRYLPTLHIRDDKVLGALGALVAQIDSDLGSVVIPGSARPPTCGGGITTNCLLAADLRQWNRLYASALGIIDNVSVMAVRDENLKPRPFGETLVADTKLWAPEFYFQDVWRIRPSLTLTYGLNYGWQTPPKEKLGRQSIQVDGVTLQAQTSRQYLQARESAARNGKIFNPPIAFQTINASGRKGVFDTDWNNLAPRFSLAWSPSFNEGFFGKVFGNRKTVIRGGYGLIYDRQNTVQSVIIPTLGVAFAQTVNVSSPLCNASGAGGTGCTATSSNPALSGFRVGRDGTIPTPTATALTSPISLNFFVNPVTKQMVFPEILSFQVDPSIQVPKNHAIDVTWQREMPGDMLLEIGYVGRFARDLTQSMSFGQVPYMHLDPASGQTFAQAFDAVALQLRSGVAAASVTPQPWFENQNPSGTKTLAAAQLSNFINGNINNVFLTIDTNRMLAGLQPFNNYVARTLFLRASTGRSNYNALFITARRRYSKGFLYQINYTFSRSLDQLGAVQNAASVMPNSFDLNAEYGPSGFDITHLFNASWLYELPFGRGRLFGTSSETLKKFIGGWYVSGIYTARSGDPLVINQGPGVWGGSLFLGFNSGAISTASPSTFGSGVHSGVTGSNNIGTNSNPATRGTGLNLFGNPESVFNSFRKVEISRDGRAGRANPLRGLSRWNLDLSLGKKTAIKERVSMIFALDFFNIFNKVDFNNPGLSLTDPRNFGVITSQFIPNNRTAGSRWIQLGMRVEF